jgi:hypothetical protein
LGYQILGVKMLKHKAGDTVLIRSQEWFGMQERDGPWIYNPIDKDDVIFVVESMSRYAGKTAKISMVHEKSNSYKLDVDNEEWWWAAWMFDPAFQGV